jgi:hypothetical protein
VTRVEPQEYASLRLVQTNVGRLLGRCDIQPSHGFATYFLATPDNRAIALCTGCYGDIVRLKQKQEG